MIYEKPRASLQKTSYFQQYYLQFYDALWVIYGAIEEQRLVNATWYNCRFSVHVSLDSKNLLTPEIRSGHGCSIY
jgi:hypothetical protein